MKNKIPLYHTVHALLTEKGALSIAEVADGLGTDKTKANGALNTLVRLGVAERPHRGVYAALPLPASFGVRKPHSGDIRPNAARDRLLRLLSAGPMSFGQITDAFVADASMAKDHARRLIASTIVDARRRGFVEAIGSRGSFRYGLVATKAAEAAA